jgi:LacI family transcriptional regulator
MSRPSTILDVARQAGVSASTVSRVFNNPGIVAKATVLRVQEAAEALEFVPNGFARGLITGRSGFAALIVPDIADPFFGRLAYSLEQALRPEGLALVICHTSEQQSEEVHLARLLEERQIDALVCVSEAPTTELTSPLERSRIPSVFVERHRASGEGDEVIFDKSSLDEAVGYLAGLGHRRIGMVPGHLGTYGGRELLTAFRAAMGRHGLSLDSDHVVPGDFKFDQTRAAAARLMSLPEPPTAVFVGSDRMTHAFLMAVAERGLRVPDDLSVLSFSTDLLDTLVSPQVTACRLSMARIAADVASLLTRRIRQPDAPFEQVLVPRTLVIGTTCGSPPVGRRSFA